MTSATPPLCPDIWHRIVPRLGLQDAAALQALCPPLRAVTQAHAAGIERAVTHTPPPAPLAALLDAFAMAPSQGFQQRVYDTCLLLSTPHDATLHFECDRVHVVARACRSHALLELRIPATATRDPAWRPGFATLQSALQAMWWVADALASRGRPFTLDATRPPPDAGAAGALVAAVAAHTQGWPGTRGPTLKRTGTTPS